MDYEVSKYLTVNNVVPPEIAFEMVEEFKKPENAYKRYMELLYELHEEYEKVIIEKLSKKKNIPIIDFNSYHQPIDLQLASFILFEEAVNYSCILLSKDEQGRIIIATDDPFHSERFDFVTSKTGREYTIVLTAHSKLIENIELIYNRAIPRSRRPSPLIGTPLPSASRVPIVQSPRNYDQQLPTTITSGEYHGKGVSERYSIYPTGNEDEPSISIPRAGNSLNRHRFQIQRAELEALANQEPPHLPCEPFKTKGGLFNWFDAKVTGEAMNQFVTDLNGVLISSNNYSIQLQKTLKEVCETFEVLDTEYLTSIYAAIISAEEAGKEAKKASDQNTENIKLIQKSIQHHTQFEKQIKSISHIKDVGQIWDDVQTLTSQISDTQTKINNIQQRIDQSITQLETRIQSYTQTTTNNSASNQLHTVTNKEKRNQSIFACILSGVALFVAIIHLLLDILGVL